MSVSYRKLTDQPVTTDITLCAGLFVRHAVFEEGSYIPQHSHTTPHLTVIAAGAVRAWKDGALLGDFVAPAGIVIEAKSEHLFLALKPGTAVLCIHRVDEASGLPLVHALHQLNYTEEA